jgi:enoyl-CoA hydratase
MSDTVLLDVENGIAVMTLNRPHQRDALNYELIDRLMVLNRIEGDAAIRAIIPTGAGERAFSAGADIHELSASVRPGPDITAHDLVRRGQTMTARLEAFKKPVIAAVNGIAFGGACEINSTLAR